MGTEWVQFNHWHALATLERHPWCSAIGPEALRGQRNASLVFGSLGLRLSRKRQQVATSYFNSSNGNIGSPPLVFGHWARGSPGPAKRFSGVRPFGPEALQKASASGNELFQFKQWQHWFVAPGVRPLGLRLSRAGATLFWCSALGA